MEDEREEKTRAVLNPMAEDVSDIKTILIFLAVMLFLQIVLYGGFLFYLFSSAR